MMNSILMQIILDMTIFFELSGASVINPDIAVSQLENIAAGLQQLNSEDRSAFVEFVQVSAIKAQAEGASDDLVNFLQTLPDDLGIVD